MIDCNNYENKLKIIQNYENPDLSYNNYSNSHEYELSKLYNSINNNIGEIENSKICSDGKLILISQKKYYKSNKEYIEIEKKYSFSSVIKLKIKINNDDREEEEEEKKEEDGEEQIEEEEKEIGNISIISNNLFNEKELLQISCEMNELSIYELLLSNNRKPSLENINARFLIFILY